MAINENGTSRTCCKCSVELGSLIYGIIIMIISGTLTCASIGILLHNLQSAQSQNEYYFYYVGFVLIPLPNLISLTFSIILVCGVCKKQPGLVLTYFIYKIVFGSILAILLCATMYLGVVAVAATIYFVVYLIFTLPLICVWKTYKKFQNARNSNLMNVQFRKLKDVEKEDELL